MLGPAAKRLSKQVCEGVCSILRLCPVSCTAMRLRPAFSCSNAPLTAPRSFCHSSWWTGSVIDNLRHAMTNDFTVAAACSRSTPSIHSHNLIDSPVLHCPSPAYQTPLHSVTKAFFTSTFGLSGLADSHAPSVHGGAKDGYTAVRSTHAIRQELRSQGSPTIQLEPRVCC